MKLFVERLPKEIVGDGVSVGDTSWASQDGKVPPASSARLCALQSSNYDSQLNSRLGARLGEPDDTTLSFDAILCSEMPMNFGIPVVFKCDAQSVNLFKVNVLKNCRSFYKHSHAMPNFYMAEGTDMDADLKENGYGLVEQVWFSTFGKALPKDQAANLSAEEANIRVMCGRIRCDNTPNGRIVYEWVASGKLRSGSIGFEIQDVAFFNGDEETDNIWDATRVEITQSFLGEFSACGEGKNHGAFLLGKIAEVGRLAASVGQMTFDNAAALAAERGIDMKNAMNRKFLFAALGAALSDDPAGLDSARFRGPRASSGGGAPGGGGGGENADKPAATAEQIRLAQEQGREQARQEMQAEAEAEKRLAADAAAKEERERLAREQADEAAVERVKAEDAKRITAATDYLEKDERAKRLKKEAPAEFSKLELEVKQFGGPQADSLELRVAQMLADVKTAPSSHPSLHGLPAHLNLGDNDPSEKLRVPPQLKGGFQSVLRWSSPREDKGMPAMQQYIKALGKLASKQGLTSEEVDKFGPALRQREESFGQQMDGLGEAFKHARKTVPNLDRFTAAGGMFLGDEFFRADISPEMLANLNEMCYGKRLSVHPNKLRLAAVQGSDVSAITHEPVMSVADYFWAFAGALSHMNPRVEYITGKPKFGYSQNRPVAQEVADPEATETFAGRINQSVFSLASKTADPCMIATRLDFDVTPENLILSQDFDTIPRAMMAMAKVMMLKEQELTLVGPGGTGRVKGIINETGIPGMDFVTPADKTGQVTLTAEELTELNKNPNRESLRKAIASVVGKNAYIPGNSGFITHTYLEQLLRDRARSRDNPGATAANNAPATKDLWSGMEGDGVGMLMDHPAAATTDFVLREDSTGADSWVDADGNVLSRTDLIYSGCWQELIIMKWTVLMMADWFDPKNAQEVKSMWSFFNKILLRNDPFYVLSNANVSGFAA